MNIKTPGNFCEVAASNYGWGLILLIRMTVGFPSMYISSQTQTSILGNAYWFFKGSLGSFAFLCFSHTDSPPLQWIHHFLVRSSGSANVTLGSTGLGCSYLYPGRCCCWVFKWTYGNDPSPSFIGTYTLWTVQYGHLMPKIPAPVSKRKPSFSKFLSWDGWGWSIPATTSGYIIVPHPSRM